MARKSMSDIDMLDLIGIKRDGRALSPTEIRNMIDGYVADRIPDYQMAAMLMAIYFNGMNLSETAELTSVMRYSGDVVDLSSIPGIKVDKHSTGGVGDKTTLIVGPIAAACGVPIAKMSGRGLGHTGGTADKLEAIPGFQTTLEPERFMEQVRKIGIALITQSGHITPADKKLYALRDVTGTVENMSLIASSIMSKKLASGSDAILLDVKCGSGAFMKDVESARELAELMVKLGDFAEKKTMAMITDMSQPLGNAVGNSLEVLESIDVLRGCGPADITELSISIAGAMIYLGGSAGTRQEGEKLAANAIKDGTGLAKFRELIENQGGDSSVCDQTVAGAVDAICAGDAVSDDPGSGGDPAMRLSSYHADVNATRSGFVSRIDAEAVGKAAQKSGAGRETMEDIIDFGAGVLLHQKVSDEVKAGQPLATVFSSDENKLEAATKLLAQAYEISESKPRETQLIMDII